MKKLLFIPIIFLSIATGFAQKGSRLDATNKNIVKIGVNTHFDGDEFPFSISWETKIAKRQSIQLGFLPRFSQSNNSKVSGIGFNAGFRNYISKNKTGIQGLYLSPQIKVGFLNDKYEYDAFNYNNNPPIYIGKAINERKVTSMAAGFLFGQHWVYKSGFSLDISAGISYYSDKEKYTDTYPTTTSRISNVKYAGISPSLQFSIGYAF